jgi:hypothetical protein
MQSLHMTMDWPINCDALTITNHSEDFSESIRHAWYGELCLGKHS